MLPESGKSFNPAGYGPGDKMSVLAVKVTRKTGGPLSMGLMSRGERCSQRLEIVSACLTGGQLAAL